MMAAPARIALGATRYLAGVAIGSFLAYHAGQGLASLYYRLFHIRSLND